jgi:hypothetical protein
MIAASMLTRRFFPTSSICCCHSADSASAFLERLRRCGEVRQPNRPAPSAERRAGHWWHVIAVGDRERFERRMRSDGFDLEAALPAMEPRPVDSECFRLQWTKTLKRVLELASH